MAADPLGFHEQVSMLFYEWFRICEATDRFSACSRNYQYPTACPLLVFLILKNLLITVRVIQKDADEKKTAFYPRPYFRLFIYWLLDPGSPGSYSVSLFCTIVSPKF
ncbi:hypothetical protein MKX03_020735 [Papaver bracteatum]|nr:hypothetical protein MKX03_020735 [Papaver bracteatum]